MGKKYSLLDKEISMINFEDVKDAYENIYEDFSGELTDENLTLLGSNCTTFLTEFRFWDRIVDFMNYGDSDNTKNDKDGVLGRMMEYAEIEASDKEIKATAKENKLLSVEEINMSDGQFNYWKEDNRSDKLANLMFMSNSCAHIISENDFSKQLEEQGIDETEMINLFFEIKNQCLENLIQCKKNGENILIGKGIEQYDKTIFFVALPGYLEPFSIHSSDPKNQLEEYDDINFYHENTKIDLLTTLPLKISEKRQKVLEYLYEQKDARDLQKVKDRIIWYIETQQKFAEIEKEKSFKENNLTDCNNEEINVKRSNAMFGYYRPNNVLENSKFIEKINEQLGDVITPNMMSGFLSRASYSFTKLFDEKLKYMIFPLLKEKKLNDEQEEKEALKVFLYIRMFKKISFINISSKNNEESKKMISDAVEKYEKAFEFMKEHKNENLSYNEMINRINEYMEKKQEENEENHEQENLVIEQLNETMIENETSEVEQIEKDEINNEEKNKKEDSEFKAIQDLTESIITKKEIKETLKETIEILKSERKKLKNSIKDNEEKLDLALMNGENREDVLSQVKELREIIEEQKQLRKNIKEEMKKYKITKKQTNLDIKSEKEERNQLIDNLEER